MKNKAILILLSALSVLAGCTVEEQYSNDKQPSGKDVTLRATREGDPKTRTVRKSDGKVWWVPGDAISLFYGSGTNGGSKFTSNEQTDTTQVTNFTGTITAITGGGELTVDDTYFWGLYPYSEDASCDGTSVTFTLPTEQTAVPGTFATGLFPSLGKSQGLIMGFYNICGGWWFSVTKEGIRKVTLKSAAGEKITGKVKVGFNASGVPEVREIIDGSDEVVLECPRGEYFEVGKKYYMVLLPTVFNSGFTMTFETYTEEGTYTRTAKTTISRSNFSGISNLDNYLTTPYAQKTGNIPVEDANFKAYLVENFDTNSDGEISYEEAAGISSIFVCTDDIVSVCGIEFMINIQSLTCYGRNGNSSSGKLTNIDVSNNTELTELRCYSNQLTVLNVSKNTALTHLLCGHNQLTSLDVSKNTALTDLLCGHNQMTSLDVSNNTALSYLEFGSNRLTSLDVSNNTALTYLECGSNQLTSLDVSKNTALTYLYCSTNQLTNLDVTKNAALTSLSCNSNQLTSLDVTKNAALTSLSCNSNQLTTLDVTKNTALTKLWCHSNQLTDLDVSNNTALAFLSCNYNQLTSLDVTKNTALTELTCYSNQLTSLDVSKNTALTKLTCDSNQLTSLDMSKNTELTSLYCSNNQLTSLDITKNTALTVLVCDNNQLTNLDVSKNTELTYLFCSNNQLTSLDVSKNTALTSLDCSHMSTLTTLYIYQDQEIPNVSIPSGTEIVVKQDGGTNEGTGEEILNP